MRSRVKTLAAGMAFLSGLLLSAQAARAAGGGITVIPDSSAIWQIINFVVLVLVLNLVLYRPIRNVVAQRKEKMDGLNSNIESFRRDAADKEHAWDDGIKKAKSRGLNEKNILIENAVAEEKQILEQISQQSQKVLSETRDKIARDVSSAAAELQREVDAFASAIGSKILGRDVA